MLEAITTDGMTEDSHCFCRLILCDLVKFRQAPQVSVWQNKRVGPLVITSATVNNSVVDISVLYFGEIKLFHP